MQSDLQKQYADLYGDFFIVDGTHGTNVHGMTLMLPCVVDCFGKTKIVGVVICHTESHEDILVGIKTLGLGKVGSIMMSDGGGAFASVSDEMDITHLLCCYHFSQDIFTTTTQMDKELRATYLKEYHILLYDAMSIETFEEKYKSLHTCLEHHPRAQRYVESLYMSRKKVVFAFVQNVFSAGCRSSQRGESMHSILKHNGSKQQKNKLKTMSLNELVNTIDDITNHQYAEDIEVIKECLASGFKTTKFVMKHMEEQKKQLDQYKVEKVNDTDFVVSGMYGSNNLQRTVVINEQTNKRKKRIK